MPLPTPGSSHHHTTSPSPPTTSPSLEENLSNLDVGYPAEMSSAVYHRVVRFDSECVLIPELQKSRKPLMITKSYAIPLWKKRTVSGESTTEEMQVSQSSSPTTGGVVFKLPLPSFMAKPARSPSRTRECSRPPCLINSDSTHVHSHYSRQPRLSNPTLPPNALPNAILVVGTHPPNPNQSSLTLSSSSPISSTFSEAPSSGSGAGTKSPMNRSPTIPFTTPIGLATTTTTDSSTLGPSLREKQGKEKEKEKDREREKDKDRIVTVPLRACCPDCFPITEESVRNGDQWKERFSKGARRRRGSSVSSVGSSEGGDDLGLYSPMASYKPLEKAKEKQEVEDKPNLNSDSRSGLASTSSTSAIADDDDTEEDVSSSLSFAVKVDEVDCIQGSIIGRLKRQPSLEQIDTEDDELSNILSYGQVERETSSSSVGSASSTFSTMSGVSSATSNTGTGGSTTSLSLVPESVSTCDQPPGPPSTSTMPPSSYTMATGKRRHKPSTPIKEDEEPPEEKYEGFCRDRERGRSRREPQRLRALKTPKLDADADDVNMLFPLPSPRRSPSTSPLNTPTGSVTPTNGESATPSPNASPTPSTVYLLNTNAPRKRSRLGVNELGDTESSPILGSGESEGEGEVKMRGERGPLDIDEARKEQSILPRSIKRKEKETTPPSIAQAAELVLAKAEAGESSSRSGSDQVSPRLAVEEGWVNIRHSKATGESGVGSMKEKKTSSRTPSSTTQKHQQQQRSISLHTPLTSRANATSPPPPPPTATRPQKQQRRSSLRAGAFLEIFRSVPGITP